MRTIPRRSARLSRAAVRKSAIALELETLARRGRLSPRRIVQWAREHRTSNLHGCFEWDNRKAGEAFRLWQARQLIVSIVVEYPDGKVRQVYVSPMSSRSPSAGYMALVDVLGDEERREEFLRQALDELQRLCTKYEDLAELAGVRAAVRLVKVKGR